ncbi:MAG: peptidoglycan-binding protein, partial [Rhodobacteraceae bacterium]|nr:peptidoglycan-binding protein [Paracoccaceae bacterium]
MRGISGSDPAGYLRNLVPNTLQYVMLRRELKRLDRVIETNGWGDLVEAKLLQEGDEGLAVVQLRNRLIRMGYMRRTPDPRFTASLSFAVKQFQKDHGLTSDGIADTTTLEAVNIEPQQRRRQVVAALERERWLNYPLGDKHVRVNIADFHADVILAGKSIFTTRVVVGQSQARLQTPEFSDQMTHMVINPTWYVPRSITTKEILPQLQEDPAAEPQL